MCSYYYFINKQLPIIVRVSRCFLLSASCYKICLAFYERANFISHFLKKKILQSDKIFHLKIHRIQIVLISHSYPYRIKIPTVTAAGIFVCENDSKGMMTFSKVNESLQEVSYKELGVNIIWIDDFLKFLR